MYMAYTMNPHLPKVRMDAVKLVRAGWSTRAVAGHLGFAQGTIVKWVHRAPDDRRLRTIPTASSRPHHHPRQLSLDTVQTILTYRDRTRRCAEVVHHLLQRGGQTVSLSSVKRVLRRNGYTNHSRWKKWHQYAPRPEPHQPGILVEIDTIHDGAADNRLYIYTLIDVCSRWAFAAVAERITTHRSLRFIEAARQRAPFSFQTLQSDHGQEFSKWLTVQLQSRAIAHRHCHVRSPAENGHLERFNRTIQDECLRRVSRSLKNYCSAIPEYIRYYNTERPHLGLGLQTPLDIIKAIPSY